MEREYKERKIEFRTKSVRNLSLFEMVNFPAALVQIKTRRTRCDRTSVLPPEESYDTERKF